MLADGYGGLELLRGPADVLATVARLSRNPLVAFVEPNWVFTHQAVSNDPDYTNGRLWGMYSDDSPSVQGPTGTTNLYGSQAEEAWGAGYTGSQTVYVGIIDEGIQFTHPDLSANVWANTYDPVDGIDNDRNGYADDTRGWDFVNGDNSIYDGTSDDHGTHVAGTIGAQGGNSTGVVGVNWNVTYISGKFLGSNGGTITNAIKAVDYMTDLKVRHGLNIVATNNSWGGGGFSQGLLDAITRGAKQNILFIAAAGNGASDNDALNFYPSNYNTQMRVAHPTGATYDAVIAVAAITSTGSLSSFSNYGATTVDLGAPGSGIFSTVPTNGYASYSGTSMATPHVTGAAALYASANAGATAAQIKAAILNSTTATASLSGKTVTGGRLNVSALMETTPWFFAINDMAQAEGDTGTTTFTFTVTLSTASTTTVTVDYATGSVGSATAGSDYTAVALTTLSFAVGETSKTVTVAVNGDTTSEVNEIFFVNLSNASGAIIADSQGVGTILNDDDGGLLSVNNVNKAEGNSGTTAFTFTVSLQNATTKIVSVDYATAANTATAASDYTAVSGRLSFAPGETSKTVTVNVNGDTTVEPDETFVVNLSNAFNAAIGNGQGIGNILDDDKPPGLAISDVTKLEGNRANTAFTFTVTLSYASANTVTVNYATADGSAKTSGKDYTAASGTLTFNPGEISKTITVFVKGDTKVESDETFFVNLSSPTNATLADYQGVGTILNDDGGSTGLNASGDTASLSPTPSTSPALDLATSPAPTVAPPGPAPGSNTADLEAYFASLSLDEEWLAPSAERLIFDTAFEGQPRVRVTRSRRIISV